MERLCNRNFWRFDAFPLVSNSFFLLLFVSRQYTRRLDSFTFPSPFSLVPPHFDFPSAKYFPRLVDDQRQSFTSFVSRVSCLVLHWNRFGYLPICPSVYPRLFLISLSAQHFSNAVCAWVFFFFFAFFLLTIILLPAGWDMAKET